MQEKIFQPLGYFSIFWIWILVFEPSFMRTASNVVHHGEKSIVVALVTAGAIIIEALVWRSKVAHMRAAHTFSEDSAGIAMILWFGHMLGSVVVFFVFLSALGLFDGNAGKFNAPDVVIVLLLTTVVIKEIVLLTQLLGDTTKPPKHSLVVTNGALLFATMIMHSCFWGLSFGSASAPLSSYGFWEMVFVQIPAAAIGFCIVYIPSRMLPFLEECVIQTETKAGTWALVGYTFMTVFFALKAIY